ncbi:FCD domain-containing protein [Salipiger mangrovisoli]|uniref:FadR family transcriptional regulator n=1 Tax=Salipiger mangrovisoli TaxID=2865933 RepID=A0ABR9XB02_9RHOB|nr:FadR family transcriptional regulator [Salipiger mangrovisoli]
MQTRTAQTIAALQAHLADNQLVEGTKLGTLKEIGETLQVSRTVVREAVAILQAQGKLEMRHGVGIFVAGDQPRPEAAGTAVMRSFAGYDGAFMDFLELRMAFEVHAAGLAALRRSWAQEEAIWSCCHAFETGLDEDDTLDQLDFDFHSAIARATNNSAFIEFFELMSAKLLPKPALQRRAYPSLVTSDYLQQSVAEHRQICEAISNADPEAARGAMAAHLSRSHERYRAHGNAS